MKKLIITMLAVILMLPALAGAAFAANTVKISEAPNVKIIMDGKLTKYTDVPITINQNTLLPLIEFLVSLGVPNDNKHIVYNEKNKSVTVYKDPVKLYLVVGNQTAYINDKPVKLNVAPTRYGKKKSIYIPYRFAAEALGKKVVLDSSASAILFCDTAKYDSIKQILNKSAEEMSLANRFMQTLVMDSTVKSGQSSMKFKVNAESQIDKLQKLMYMNMVVNMFGIEVNMDTYYSGNNSYMRDQLNQTWKKKTYLPAEYDVLFNNQSNMGLLKVTDPLCAGLSQVQGSSVDEILLKGNVFMTELFKKAVSSQEAGKTTVSDKDLNFNTFFVEISLNSSTYLVNSIVMNAGSVQTTGKTTVRTDIGVKIQNSDYNSDFQIIVPEDAIQNATEVKK